ncbi:MAG: CDP-diacylglycerol--serine O-phosphatidyltransferase [Bacteroidota bacterium]|nr:CDP-diacylglycerol--serine O-phosphatidyltransferase [Bacteroidota bacterium]
MYLIKKNIPNILTLSNMLCGVLAILASFEGNLTFASLFVFSALCFDFFDGFIARLLNLESELGKQLDSLSDMVSFGVAPSIILFQLLYFENSGEYFQSELNDIKDIFPAVIALLLPIFSAIRLAKFNIDEKQKTTFIGLPAPAAAAFIISIPLILNYQNIPNSSLIPIFENKLFLIFTAIILPVLLISNLKLLSFKSTQEKKSRTQASNIIKWILIIISIVLLIILKFISIPFIIILYLILSLINNLIKHEI